MSFAQNKKASLDYSWDETYEAGAKLEGHEVKALRAGMGELTGAHVVVRAGEAFLIGATIPPYQVGNTPKGYESDRTRKLLLNKKELAQLSTSGDTKGLTIIPIKWYNSKRRVKLLIAVAARKKKYDKRATLKEKDSKREIDRTLKNY